MKQAELEVILDATSRVISNSLAIVQSDLEGKIPLPKEPDLSGLEQKICDIRKSVEAASGAIQAQMDDHSEMGQELQALLPIQETVGDISSKLSVIEESQLEIDTYLAEELEKFRKDFTADVEESLERAALESNLFLAQASQALSEMKLNYQRDVDSINKLRPIDGSTFIEGSYGTSGCSLYRAKINTQRTPAQDPGAWEIIAAGVETLRVEEKDRAIVITTQVAGSEPNSVCVGRTVRHLGPYKKGQIYRENDCIMSDGQTWICVADETTVEPGTTTDDPIWRLMAMRGKSGRKGDSVRGLKGDPGDGGDPGVGILQLKYHEDALVVVKTDGEADRIELRGLEDMVEKMAARAVEKLLPEALR